MTPNEIAIARSVIYASLFDYPLTLDQLHHALLESDQSPSEILATYGSSERLRRVIGFRDGFFFPGRPGRAGPVSGGIVRCAAGRFLQRYRSVLRLICAVPFTRYGGALGQHRSSEPRAWRRPRSLHRGSWPARPGPSRSPSWC
jgi:hypothetical protein